MESAELLPVERMAASCGVAEGSGYRPMFLQLPAVQGSGICDDFRHYVLGHDGHHGGRVGLREVLMAALHWCCRVVETR
ncbi:hypothetical protein GCM10010525_35150 [Glutamicibacter bergerei]